MNNNIVKRANRVLKIACAMAEPNVRTRIEEMQLHFDGYAEPGYDSKTGIVATGNWNNVGTYNHQTKNHNLPARIFTIFEKMGIECEWSDEWTTCYDCGKLIRTSADSYSWQPSFWLNDCEIICHDCIEGDPQSYLEAHEGNANTCITVKNINPEDYNYIKVNKDSFESGWHSGQTDNPKKVAAELKEKGVERFLFKLDENSQFYSKWSVYVHEDEEGKLD